MRKQLKPLKTPSNVHFYSYIADTAGCGTIRVIFPYLLLNHFNQIKNLGVSSSYGMYYITEPGFYKKFFVCQWQRSVTDEHLRMLQHFKLNIQRQTKTGMVYEIDDLLVDIPEWNFAHDYYKNYEKNVPLIMGLCDAVVCSTEPLKKFYSKYNPKCVVISNKLPRFIWGTEQEKTAKEKLENPSKKIRIFWGGSQNHFNRNGKGGDFGPGLLKYIRETKDRFTWVFMGAIPWELQDIKSDFEFHGWKSTFEHPSYIKSLNIDIGIAPLSDNFFNSCKSNIKALEYTAMGVPGVYSKLEPYKEMTLTGKTDEDIISYIEELAENPDLRYSTWETDFDSLKGKLFWEEGDNLKEYINSYLKIFGNRLPNLT
jgi:hypothetical protein